MTRQDFNRGGVESLQVLLETLDTPGWRWLPWRIWWRITGTRELVKRLMHALEEVAEGDA